MPPKFIRMNKGEKIIDEWKDNSSLISRKMGLITEGSSIRAGVAKKFNLTWHHGTLFLTNLRIIFESFDGNTSDEVSHDIVDNSEGIDGNHKWYWLSTHGELKLYHKKKLIREYYLYCGAELSTKLNQEFYTQEIINERLIIEAEEYEKHLDYENAIEIYEEIGKPREAARVRKIVADQKKVDQTIVQGDQITKTEIKDSVLNRSNVGSSGKSKAEEIKEIKELLDSGAIEDDEFKQMKKDILGK